MSIVSCCLGAADEEPFGASGVGLSISGEGVVQGNDGLFDDLTRDSCAFEDHSVGIAHRCRERGRPGVLPDEQRG